MLRPHHRRLDLERLEERAMLTTGWLSNGWVGVLGTKGNDSIQVTSVGGNIQVNDNGYLYTFGAAPKVAILALDGDDEITIDDSVTIPVWVDAGKGNDTIKLGSGDDIVSAGAGNDVVFGAAGNDWLFGDAGDDDLSGGLGDDLAGGGKGNDVIHGGPGADLLSGDAGNDFIYGGDDEDICDGAAGNDSINGGAGADELMGGAGLDQIFGFEGDDRIDGGAGVDSLYGGLGNDRLKGGAGVDFLDGDDGNNLLDKDKGKDTIANGIEADLDVEYRAVFSTPGGAHGTASYELQNDNGLLVSRLAVQVDNMPSNSTLNVTIGSSTVGQIVTDNSGHGELQLSNSPTPSTNELAFPTKFPKLSNGAKVSVGSTLKGKLVKSFLISASLPPLPKV